MSFWLKAGAIRLGRAAGVLLSLLATTPTFADVPGSKDPIFLTRYPLSNIVEYSEQFSPEYRLALGGMKKINGVISPEAVSSRAGSLTRITYRIPDGHNSLTVFEQLLTQLLSNNFTVLYRCDGRGCGSSNQWANSQFGIPRLYGVDREQHYAALERETGDTLAIYSVKRGNKRVYLHIDWLAANDETDRLSLIERLQRHERVLVQTGDSLDALAEELKRLRHQRPAQRIWLVGHSDQGEDTDARIKASIIDAEQLRERLAVLGVDNRMLLVQGVGDLTPSYDQTIPSRRIELVLEK